MNDIYTYMNDKYFLKVCAIQKVRNLRWKWDMRGVGWRMVEIM